MWQLRVPSKVKTFVWRACTNLLPTMVNLVKRKVGFSPIYSCKRELENTLHVLWGCENIKFVWCKDFCELNVENHPLDSFVDLSSLTLSNPKGAKLFAMICWSLWTRRNKTRVGGSTRPLPKVFGTIGQHLKNFNSYKLSVRKNLALARLCESHLI